MKFEFNNETVEWLIKALGAGVLIAAAFGKFFAAVAGVQGDNTSALCFGIGCWMAAPIIGSFIPKKSGT